MVPGVDRRQFTAAGTADPVTGRETGARFKHTASGREVPSDAKPLLRLPDSIEPIAGRPAMVAGIRMRT